MVHNWDKAYREHGILQKNVRELVKEAAVLFKENDVEMVLDHGFGTGRHTVFLAENGFGVYGIDISEKAREITQETLDERELDAKLVVGDIKALPYGDNFFDATISTFVLNHGTKNDRGQAIREVERTLNKNGFLVMEFTSPNDTGCGQGEEIEPGTFLGVNDIDMDIPHHFYTKKELEQLLPGFKFIKFCEIRGYSERRKCKSAYWQIIAQKQ